ncbi:Fank1 [Symbiodinium sp. CCMP2456]|nr:Fank1 [Symbiodinium sp. CCMP2456]
MILNEILKGASAEEGAESVCRLLLAKQVQAQAFWVDLSTEHLVWEGHRLNKLHLQDAAKGTGSCDKEDSDGVVVARNPKNRNFKTEPSCEIRIRSKADVNARDQNNMTPLMGCVVGGDFSGIVSLLLEARADAAAVTDDGFTALKWATRPGPQAAKAVLEEQG